MEENISEKNEKIFTAQKDCAVAVHL